MHHSLARIDLGRREAYCLHCADTVRIRSGGKGRWRCGNHVNEMRRETRRRQQGPTRELPAGRQDATPVSVTLNCCGTTRELPAPALEVETGGAFDFYDFRCDDCHTPHALVLMTHEDGAPGVATVMHIATKELYQDGTLIDSQTPAEMTRPSAALAN